MLLPMNDLGDEIEQDSTNHERAAAKYGLLSTINAAWLADGVTTLQVQDFSAAWDAIVVSEEWRAWTREHLSGKSPFLYLAVRDGLGALKLIKTKRGVSAHLPHQFIVDAQEEGRLIPFYMDLIRQIYAKWANVSGAPLPPSLPSEMGAGA